MMIKQCCSCEQTFEHFTEEKGIEAKILGTEDRSCPHCGSGNWVYGFIDEPEPKGVTE